MVVVAGMERKCRIGAATKLFREEMQDRSCLAAAATATATAIMATELFKI
jgi:hypothetical protein